MGQKCSVTWSVVCAQRLEQRPTSGDPRPCVSVCVRGGNCKIRHTAAAAAAASVTAVIQAFFSHSICVCAPWPTCASHLDQNEAGSLPGCRRTGWQICWCCWNSPQPLFRTFVNIKYTRPESSVLNDILCLFSFSFCFCGCVCFSTDVEECGGRPSERLSGEPGPHLSW